MCSASNGSVATRITTCTRCPTGPGFAVAEERDEAPGTSRTIGFLVADLDVAVAELRSRGIEIDDPSSNEQYRYAHVVAPDGELYELVEWIAASGAVPQCLTLCDEPPTRRE